MIILILKNTEPITPTICTDYIFRSPVLKWDRILRKESKVMGKKNKERIIVARINSVEATLANKPYYVPAFRCGAHITQKDRPRDKNWRRWV